MNMSLNIKEFGWEQCSRGEICMIEDIVNKAYCPENTELLDKKLSPEQKHHLLGMRTAFNMVGYDGVWFFDTEELKAYKLEERFPGYAQVFGMAIYPVMFDDTLGVTIVCRQSVQPNTQESTEQETDENEIADAQLSEVTTD